jgi:hypothetical protein
VATPQYAALRNWLKRAPEDHFWNEPLLLIESHDGSTVASINRIIEVLESAKPGNLKRKKTDFRKDLDVINQLSLRYELLVGSKIATKCWKFQFGGKAKPDIEIDEPALGGSLSVELTTRTKDDFQKLVGELEIALRPFDISITLDLDERPLAINEALLAQICAELVQLLQQNSGKDNFVVPLPTIGGKAWCTFSKTLGNPKVTPKTGSNMTNHFNQMEPVLRDVIKGKVQQSQNGNWNSNTILLIDITRIGLSWVRPLGTWAQVIRGLDLDWPNIPFVAIGVTVTSLDSEMIQVAFEPNPRLTNHEIGAVNTLMNAIAGPLID